MGIVPPAASYTLLSICSIQSTALILTLHVHLAPKFITVGGWAQSVSHLILPYVSGGRATCMFTPSSLVHTCIWCVIMWTYCCLSNVVMNRNDECELVAAFHMLTRTKIEHMISSAHHYCTPVSSSRAIHTLVHLSLLMLEHLPNHNSIWTHFAANLVICMVLSSWMMTLLCV